MSYRNYLSCIINVIKEYIINKCKCKKTQLSQNNIQYISSVYLNVEIMPLRSVLHSPTGEWHEL